MRLFQIIIIYLPTEKLGLPGVEIPGVRGPGPVGVVGLRGPGEVVAYPDVLGYSLQNYSFKINFSSILLT